MAAPKKPSITSGTKASVGNATKTTMRNPGFTKSGMIRGRSNG
jgi:hypothetical protein